MGWAADAAPSFLDSFAAANVAPFNITVALGRRSAALPRGAQPPALAKAVAGGGEAVEEARHHVPAVDWPLIGR